MTEKLVEEMAKAGMRIDPDKTIHVLLYEFGDLAKALVYAATNREDLRPAYLLEARIALADMIMQTRVLAQGLGWNWDEVKDEGEDRLRERIKEFAEGVI